MRVFGGELIGTSGYPIPDFTGYVYPGFCTMGEGEPISTTIEEVTDTTETGGCTLINCYASITIGAIDEYDWSFLSPLIQGYAKIVNSYSDSDANGFILNEDSSDPPYSYPFTKTTNELKYQSTFTNWDFDNVWQIDEGNSMPTLRPQENSLGNNDTPLEPLIASFEISVLNDTLTLKDISLGNPDSYLWDFGDGTTSTEQNPTHTYSKAGSYSVTLTVYRGEISSKLTKEVVIESITSDDPLPIPIPPTAIIKVTPSIGYKWTIFNFSTESEGMYLWDFGDGTTSTEQNPTHIYNEVGYYKVNLTVRDTNNLKAVSSTTIIVIDYNKILFFPLLASLNLYADIQIGNTSNINQCLLLENRINFFAGIKIPNIPIKVPPIAQIITNVYYGFKPLTITFSTPFGEDNTIFYEWDFGDGNTSTDPIVNHIYNKAGIYTVKLKVRNLYGETTSSIQIYVIGWIGKYTFHLPQYDYYYILDREGNYVYIFDYNTYNLLMSFGGKGVNLGQFDNPTTMALIMPQF
jgi:PKD repeat protein